MSEPDEELRRLQLEAVKAMRHAAGHLAIAQDCLRKRMEAEELDALRADLERWNESAA